MPASSRTAVWLQGTTLAWMLVECCVSLYAAAAARSPAMLAFGSDSLVELISASVVLLQYVPGITLRREFANRVAAILLFALAGIVPSAAIASLALRMRPEKTWLGIGVTVAALLGMPVLAWLKRREARRLQNRAMAADAVQSATCAYLALITLLGLAANATFGVPWFDPAAALVALPLLIKEGKDAWRGRECGCG
jgi:Cation efflux family